MDIIEIKYTEAVQGIKEEWLVNTNNNWYEYVIKLPIKTQIVYLVIVLHNQVFNGGFHQYFVNGYGQFAKETINALIKIGAIKKANLLQLAFAKVNINNNAPEIFRSQLIKKEIKPLFEGDDLYEPLDKLDSEYYLQEDEDIVQLLNRYLLEKNS